MASLIQRGDVWYVRYYDAKGKRKLKAGYTDRTKTRQLGERLEMEKRAIQTGDVDPQAQERKKERVRPISEHVTDYRIALQARGSSDNHVAYTIADIEKCFDHAG